MACKIGSIFPVYLQEYILYYLLYQTMYVVAEPQANPNNPPAVNPSPQQDNDHSANRQGKF